MNEKQFQAIMNKVCHELTEYQKDRLQGRLVNDRMHKHHIKTEEYAKIAAHFPEEFPAEFWEKRRKMGKTLPPTIRARTLKGMSVKLKALKGKPIKLKTIKATKSGYPPGVDEDGL
jgi:CRISPR/Cas system-associated protein Csx1